jgi:hypothetical protein
MHSSACFLEYTESDTARLLENTDAQWLHGVACPVGGLHHRERGEAFTKLLESKPSLRGIRKASRHQPPACRPQPSIAKRHSDFCPFQRFPVIWTETACVCVRWEKHLHEQSAPAVSVALRREIGLQSRLQFGPTITVVALSTNPFPQPHPGQGPRPSLRNV